MKQNNSFNDIIPPGEVPNQKRTIRNVPINTKKPNKIDELLKETEELRAEHSHPIVHTDTSEVPLTRVVPPTTIINNSPRRGSRKHVWLGLISILVLAILSLFLFNSAEVLITLKTQSIPVDLNVNAAADITNATGTLQYVVLPVKKEGTKEVSATGVPTKVEKRASGTIVVFNNYSDKPQDLIATTRFETSDGLVYKIDKPIRVPGTTKVNGQTVPGSVEAVVYADLPGPKYNLERADFVIPGFRNTPKFAGFYARSKTALTGGYSGLMPQVSDAELKAANDELKTSLTAQALSELQTQKPGTHVFFKEGVRSTYNSDLGVATNGKATLTGRVSIEGLIFEKMKLEQLIAENNNGEKYHFDNLEVLTLAIQNEKVVSTFVSGPVLSLKLTGNLTTGQSFDENALKRALADKSKTQLNEILRMYPEIVKAEATLRPFWNNSFPENPNKINVIVTKE